MAQHRFQVMGVPYRQHETQIGGVLGSFLAHVDVHDIGLCTGHGTCDTRQYTFAIDHCDFNGCLETAHGLV